MTRMPGAAHGAGLFPGIAFALALLASPSEVGASVSADVEVTTAAELFDQLNAPGAENPLSLHVVGELELGGQTVVIAAGRQVTLWGDGIAVLDGQDMAQVVQVQGSLVLQGVDVVRGRAASSNGACIRVTGLGAFRMVGGSIAHCKRHNGGTLGSVIGGGAAAMLGYTFELIGTTIEDCSVETLNGSPRGGGLFLWAGAATLSQVVFRNNRVESNRGIAGGGGICVGGGSLLLTDAQFFNCSAQTHLVDAFGGGLAVRNGADIVDVQVKNVSFHGTSAVTFAGQAFGGGVGIYDRQATLEGVSFHSTWVQSTTNEAYGGGLATSRGVVQASDVQFYETLASSDDGQAYGGGVGMSGGDVNIHRALFDGTECISTLSAGTGGGLGMSAGRSTVRDASFVETSTAQSSVGNGGAVGLLDGSASLLDCETTDTFSPGSGLSVFAGAAAQITTAMLTINQDCTALGVNRPLIRTLSVTAPARLRNLTLNTRGCTNRVSATGGIAECDSMDDLCAIGATCFTVADDQGISTPQCKCPATTFASPDAPTDALAPYTSGCISPLVAETLQREAPEVILFLEKTATSVPYTVIPLTLRVTGTAWVLNGMADEYAWRVNESLLAPWLRVVDVAGNVTEPQFTGVVSLAKILINVSAANVSDSPTPYTSVVRVHTELPSADSSAIVPQVQEIPVQLYVNAEPVAAMCTFAPAELQERQIIELDGERNVAKARFIARDVEGLPVERPGIADLFSARRYQCTDRSCTDRNLSESIGASVVYVGAELGQPGMLEVRTTLVRLHASIVAVTLNGEPLPFTSVVRLVCPSGEYTALCECECNTCPASAECSAGATQQDLVLRPNHWRISPLTMDIHECNKQGTQPTPCFGGGNASSYCYAGLTGPMCQVCEEPWHYIDIERAAAVHAGNQSDPLVQGSICKACPAKSSVVAVLIPLFILICTFAALGLAVAVCLALSSRYGIGRSLALDASRFWEDNGGKAKFKIAFGFYQVVLTLPVIVDIPVPDWYTHAMSVFGFFAFDFASIEWWVGDSLCLGRFQDLVTIQGSYPLIVFAGLIPPTVAVYALYRLASRDDETIRSAIVGGVQCTVPVGLYVAFFAVPSRARALAPAFNCQSFVYDPETGQEFAYLRADVRVECWQRADGGAERDLSHAYQQVLWRAQVWLCVWSIFVPLCIAAMLFRMRSVVRSNRLAASMWRLLTFLHGDYSADYYWWDLLELMRKLVLTGLLLLMVPDTDPMYAYLRLTIALVVTVGYLVALIIARPFRESHGASTLAVAIISNVSLFCARTPPRHSQRGAC